MRYVIDTKDNGYLLTIKQSANGDYVSHLVFLTIQEVIQEIKNLENDKES